MRPLFLLPPAYLLVGCILMLVVSDLVDGAVTRGEFVKGMIVWPVILLRFCGVLIAGLWERFSG
jgi:hypothetical protein